MDKVLGQSFTRVNFRRLKVTLSVLATLTVTPTLSHSPNPSVTAAAGIEPATKLIALPFPNPNPWAVAVHLNGYAKSLHLKVYTVSLVLVGPIDLGPQPQGWVYVPLPQAVIDKSTNGTFYFRVSAGDGSMPSVYGRFYFSR